MVCNMFESLSDKLQAAFSDLARKGKLTESDVDDALRLVRMALLEADVHYGVVKDFVARVRERAIGGEVMRSLSPAQQVIKIVHDELVTTLGDGRALDLGRGTPPVILMAGLQGSGKTTTAAKLALELRKKGRRPLLVACDTRRPAAIDQLQALGAQLDIPVYSEGTDVAPPDIAARGLLEARRNANTVVIVDTSGRLQIDTELMDEIQEISRRVTPSETLLVVDSMTGQEAVNVAAEFHARLSITGLVLTKIDGDARGGAALSVRAVTGVPIAYLGTGEKVSALEPFHPDRLAGRILGMGDVLSLIERAESTLDTEVAERMERRLRKGQLDLEDFLSQLRQLKKMGPLQELLGMIPGLGRLRRELPEGAEIDDRQLKKVEAIILSMTPVERRNPKVLNGSRKRRVAAGSGTTVQDVNLLIKQFQQMQKMMKQLSRGRQPRGMIG
jgi:signal recognition particle subunit SRP54